MNSTKTDIIKAVTEYNSHIKVLSPVIKRYFEENNGGWKYFNGWGFSNNGETIVIHYSYEEFCGNTETCMESSFEIVPLDDILEYMQSQKTK